MAQWAKRPPPKLEVPGSNPRGWFSGPAGKTARGVLSLIRLIGRAQYFPGGLAASSLKRVSITHPFAVSAKKDRVLFLFNGSIAGHFFQVRCSLWSSITTNRRPSICDQGRSSRTLVERPLRVSLKGRYGCKNQTDSFFAETAKGCDMVTL